MPFVIFVVIVILFLGYIVKLNHDLIVNKDNLLRALAALDAVIISKNLAILDVLGYAQETMEKDKTLINSLFNMRHDINRIRTKISNAQERYEKQQEFDKQIELLLNAVSRYPDLKKNAGFQKSLIDFANIETQFNERVQRYNDAVVKLQHSIHSFPSSILAQLAHTKEPPPIYQK